MRISDWSSDVCSSDLNRLLEHVRPRSEGEVEGGALAYLAGRPQAPAVLVDDPLNGGEADAGSGKLAGVVQALKGAKELVGMCHVETRSVVADEIGVLPLVAAAAELDAGRRAPGGELPGVAQQVLQSDLQQLGIAPYDHGRLDHEVRHPVRRVRLQVR